MEHYPKHPRSSKHFVKGCLESLKAFKKEMFGGSNTYSRNKALIRPNSGTIVVNSPLIRPAISWGKRGIGGPLRFPGLYGTLGNKVRSLQAK